MKDLSDALFALVKTQAMNYVKAEVIRRTVFASLMSSLAPIAWLKVGRIIGGCNRTLLVKHAFMTLKQDNPWANARALALKAGRVLGDLLANRVFGTRPVTLCGYSLGSLVILEALKHLASLPPKDTIGLIEDVFLYGSPISTDQGTWAAARRLIAGRFVNGYSSNDYVLAVLSRASNVTWDVAGLEPVGVKDVENQHCDFVDGHNMWRGLIGRALQEVGAPGVVPEKVALQTREVAEPMEKALAEESEKP